MSGSANYTIFCVDLADRMGLSGPTYLTAIPGNSAGIVRVNRWDLTHSNELLLE